MLVRDWIGTVKVHVLVPHKATVLVLCTDVRCCDAVPRVTHSATNVLFGEAAGIQHACAPHVEEGVVERTETFGRCRRNEQHLLHLLAAPIMELSQHVGRLMDARAIEHENERVHIECACRLRKEVTNVLQQHLLRHTSLSLRRIIDDRRQSGGAAAAGYHVVAWGVGGSVGSMDKRRLTWQCDRVALHVTLPFVSLIEEEDVIGADALQLASHLRDLLAHVGRH